MKLENIITTVLIGCIALIALFTGMIALQGEPVEEETLQGASFINDFSIVGVSSSVALTAGTSTEVLPANVARQYARVTNAGSSNVYLRFSNSPATTTAGVLLHASSTIEIDQTALYTGAIQGTADANSTVYVTEK